MIDKMDLGSLRTLLLKPTDHWANTLADPGELKTLLMPRLLILATLSGLAWFFGMFVGHLVEAIRLGFFFRLLFSTIISGILVVGINLGLFVGLGVMIEQLAVLFGGRRDRAQANKLAAGAVIPMWLGSMLVITTLSWLGMAGTLLGLGYGAYVLHSGLEPMIGLPRDKRLPLVVTTVAVMLLAGLVTSVGLHLIVS